MRVAGPERQVSGDEKEEADCRARLRWHHARRAAVPAICALYTCMQLLPRQGRTAGRRMRRLAGQILHKRNQCMPVTACIAHESAGSEQDPATGSNEGGRDGAAQPVAPPQPDAVKPIHDVCPGGADMTSKPSKYVHVQLWLRSRGLSVVCLSVPGQRRWACGSVSAATGVPGTGVPDLCHGACTSLHACQ